MRSKSLSILISLIICGCDCTPTKIDLDLLLESKIDYVSLVDEQSVEIIKLEATTESLLGNISKVEIFEDNIYVLDDSRNQVFMFNINGEFIRKIGDAGRRRDEYIKANNFIVDRMNRHVIVSDRGGIKQIVYDLDGEFVSSYKLRYTPMAILRDGSFVFVVNPMESDERYELARFDSDGELIKGYYERRGYVEKNEGYYMPNQYFAQNSEGYYFMPLYTSRMMLLSYDGEMSDVLELNFKQEMLDYEKSPTLYDKSKIWSIRDLYITDDGVYTCGVIYGSKGTITLFGDINNRDKVIGGGLIDLTTPKSHIKYLGVVGVYGNKFISQTFVDDELRKQYPTSTEFDNPFLVLFKVDLTY